MMCKCLRVLAMVPLPLLLAGCFCASAVTQGPAQRRAQSERESSPPATEFADDFDAGALDSSKWLITRKNDFAEFTVDVVGEEDGRLRLRCGTRGTDDSTVKFLGVVSRTALDLSGKKRLRLDFDWNNQANGSYLSGAIYLCPTLTRDNPADELQWLRIEYVGVPPGRNARAAVWLTDGSMPRWLYDEGWPREQRAGRKIGRLRLVIAFDEGLWRVLEDGKLLFEGVTGGKLPFERAYLYLQMSSHSNYPVREVFFDNVGFGMAEEGAR